MEARFHPPPKAFYRRLNRGEKGVQSVYGFRGDVKRYWVYVLIKLRIHGINLRQA
jgi:hypothetical protein